VGRVVVGVDGSENSRAALEWAAEQARKTGGDLVVVHAWTVPVMTYGTWLVPYAPALEAKRSFRESARAMVNGVLANANVEDLHVDVRLVEGHPGDALVRESHDAQMVVVGNRGRRPLAEFVLGSTTQYVSRHSAVPVVVVPERAPSFAAVA
jgi:nucleotide-binding universal stress UspA family protein